MSIILAIINCFVALGSLSSAFGATDANVVKIAAGVGILALLNFLHLFSKALDE
jgi:hypothetical protein